MGANNFKAQTTGNVTLPATTYGHLGLKGLTGSTKKRKKEGGL